jgi:hypothetical protein
MTGVGQVVEAAAVRWVIRSWCAIRVDSHSGLEKEYGTSFKSRDRDPRDCSVHTCIFASSEEFVRNWQGYEGC